jgi:hypothetical protein
MSSFRPGEKLDPDRRLDPLRAAHRAEHLDQIEDCRGATALSIV